MSPQALSFILVGVLLNSAAQLLLKAGVRPLGELTLRWDSLLAIATRWPIAAGLACYVVSVAAWILALSRVDVSMAYPMLSLGYVVNALGAWWLFHESLTQGRLAGIALILVGVIVLSRH